MEHAARIDPRDTFHKRCCSCPCRFFSRGLRPHRDEPDPIDCHVHGRRHAERVETGSGFGVRGSEFEVLGFSGSRVLGSACEVHGFKVQHQERELRTVNREP